ncbi:MAG: hypothetical protein COV76_02215 [Candidatus Omnitrophica bacterium CG11_big_fil_rev_8_21_14_0_20_64_10]|nr:MAG: hypothetical protein COV76_02215 [Candidatus Omnitrophica bacterium CG11_big_fil_rev_8_21_14_0_20_64_10]
MTDPTPERKAARYAACKRSVWSGQLLLTLTGLWLLACSPAGLRWAARAAAGPGPWPVQLAGYLLPPAAILFLLRLPLDWLGGHWLERRFGLSDQPLSRWLGDQAKQTVLSIGFGGIIVGGLFFLFRTTPAHWWLWAGGFWFGWSAFLSWIAPIWLIPLFYRQRPLADAALQNRLEGLVRRCGTPIRGIFEINLSKNSRKANACLCGMGSSRRILLSDTLIAAHPTDEVEVVLAHEIGHHRLGHIPRMIVLSTLGAWGSLGLIQWILLQLHRQPGGSMGSDLSALTFLALLVMTFELLVLPLTNGFSRRNEKAADRYALEITRNPAAFIRAMERLAEKNLSQVNPPPWVEWIFHSHPPISKRIAFARNFEDNRGS